MGGKVCAQSRSITLAQARQLAYGMCVGVAYLHSAGIYHRDLKPANCLANYDCCVKVCDFNLARLACIAEEIRSGPLARIYTEQVCAPWYRAPEVVLKLPYNGAMDVWSAGCVVAELFYKIGCARCYL